MSFHKDLRGDDLHPTKIELVSSSPINNRTPEYVGETLVDTEAKAMYTATGLTSDDWEIIGAAGAGLIISAADDVDTTDRENETILEWDSTLEKYVHIPDMQGKSAGLVTPGVSLTDNADGSITLSGGDVVLYDNENYDGKPAKYSFTGNTFTLTNNAVNYIIVNYNGGSPVLQNITDVSTINESNIIPVRTIYRNGTDLVGIDWDSLADGMTNKLHMRFVKTERFGWESGLALSESSGVVSTTSGKVWYGAVRTDIDAFSSDTDEWSFWYHSSGEWVEDKTTTTYNSTQYDNGTDLQTANNNRWTVNWIYRCSCLNGGSPRGAYILSDEQYNNLAQASASQPPEAPSIINATYFLVGRIIVDINGPNPSVVEGAFNRVFEGAPTTTHNNLGGLNEGDYQHLTQSELSLVQNIGTLSAEPVLPSFKTHRVAAQSSTAINTWEDVVFDTTVTEESTSHFSRSGGVITVSGISGLLQIFGCIRPIWDGTDSEWDFATTFARVVTSSDGGNTFVESRCLQAVKVKPRQIGQTETLPYSGTVAVSDGDQIKLQFQVDDLDLNLQGSSVFDSPVAASMTILYHSKLD